MIPNINGGSPGTVFVVPNKSNGRRKNFGTVAFIEGRQVICLGYTQDGKNVMYAEIAHLERIAKCVKRAVHSPIYRVLKFLLARYELADKAQGPDHRGEARGARARRKGAVIGSISSIAPKSLPGV